MTDKLSHSVSTHFHDFGAPTSPRFALLRTDLGLANYSHLEERCEPRDDAADALASVLPLPLHITTAEHRLTLQDRASRLRASLTRLAIRTCCGTHATSASSYSLPLAASHSHCFSLRVADSHSGFCSVAGSLHNPHAILARVCCCCATSYVSLSTTLAARPLAFVFGPAAGSC